MMRVLVVDRSGAAPIWALMGHIAEALVARGDDVVFCRMVEPGRTGEGPVPAGVRRRDVPVPRRRGPWDVVRQTAAFAAAFRKVLATEAPDIVHTNFAVPGVAARWLASRHGGVRVVSTHHELFDTLRWHLYLAQRLTEGCSAVHVYISAAVATSYGRSAGYYTAGAVPSRHLVIPNGVPVRALQAAAAGAPARTPGRLVYPARLVPEKGQATLLNALARLTPEAPELHLVLVGDGKDRGRLEELARTLGVAAHVTFVGWQAHADVVTWLASAEALVAPGSTTEGFGLALAEAMAMGTPVVASDIPAYTEVMGTPTDVAWPYPSGDSRALARAIHHMRAHPAERARRAARAAARAEAFDVTAMTARYLGLYDRLTGQRGPARTREH